MPKSYVNVFSFLGSMHPGADWVGQTAVFNVLWKGRNSGLFCSPFSHRC